MIVIAANAGGAWSPMGNVTATMLWIGGQITAWGIIEALFRASVVNLLVLLITVTVELRGRPFKVAAATGTSDMPPFERNLFIWRSSL